MEATQSKVTPVARGAYAGLFLVTLSSLMYEILLTRIFSVTMWYHFAFMAVSIALFGMTVGGIIVYLLPERFTPEKAYRHIALAALGFAASAPLGFLTHLSVPFQPRMSVIGLYSTVLTYVALAVPFICSGICVCLVMTKLSRDVSKLYAVDLLGAAVGCLALIYVLRLADGPTTVFFISLMAGVSALLFALQAGSRRLAQAATLGVLLLALFVGYSTWRAIGQSPLIRLTWIKGEMTTAPALYEKWNSFSMLRVTGNPDAVNRPSGNGLSSNLPKEDKIHELFITIDANAETSMCRLDDGSDFARYDVVNLAHYIRHDAQVLIIGPGGGRDVLSALAFNQKAVVGVEINGDLLDIANQVYGDFTGHLDRDPRVTFVVDEARSYIARSEDKFDIIQASLIDTWAATAAGAFVLSENSLYTVEAWDIFLHHLTPGGVLSFSRWYFPDQPAEAYRLTALATQSLLNAGIQEPRRHIVMVRRLDAPDEGPTDSVATLLVSNEPFPEQDLDTIEQVAREMNYEIVLSPRSAINPMLAEIASGQKLAELTANYPLNIAAPTDNSPFFFQMLRLGSLFGGTGSGNSQFGLNQGIESKNMLAVVVLGSLLVAVVGLTILCIVIPVLLRTRKGVLRGTGPFSLFFLSIGLGYMLVEVSQMQRLIVFLGHPTYGLSIVLFALLLSSGLGSYLSEKVDRQQRGLRTVTPLLALLVILLVFGFLTPSLVRLFQTATTSIRILVAVAMLFPLGLFMGQAFPLGIRAASGRAAELKPWLWGINGAASVCASVLAVVIAISAGISTTFWTGFACYAIAAGSLAWVLWQGRTTGERKEITIET